jgi:uncharacterized membrane protein YbhN (UPF0104 family)
MSGKRKTHIVHYVVSAALLIFVFLKIDNQVFVNELLRTNPAIVVFATIAILLQIVFLNYRWHMLLNTEGNEIPLKTSIFINLAGYFANVFFLTAIGGILAKSGLAIRNGLSFKHALLATLMDRFMTLTALVALTALCLPFLSHILSAKIANILILCVILFLVTSLVGFILVRYELFNRLWPQKIRAKLPLEELTRMARNIPFISKLTVLSLLAQIAFIAGVVILSLNTTSQASTFELLVLIPVLALVASLPISFGGWGVREGAFVYGLGLIGFSAESAFLLSVQIGIVTMIAPLIMGMPYILDKNWDFLSGKQKQA